MSKKVYLFSLVLLALTFASCSETKEAGRYDNWRARSEAFIDSIATVCNSAANKALPDDDPKKLYAFTDQTNNQTIYVKKLKKDGNSTDKPFYTSTVSAYYRMSYFNGDVVQQTFTGEEPGQFEAVPINFALDQVISGWGYTIPEMTVGDFWTLYIPYQSGYDSGTGPSGDLQPYSALVYKVQLAAIVKK